MVHLTGYNQADFNETKPSRKSWIFIVLFVSVLAVIGFAVGTSSNEIEVVREPSPFWQRMASMFNFSEEDDPEYLMPKPEENRLDILILGIRGANDPDADRGGALLTDTIMLFSFDKTTRKASIVSIPRDLYVKVSKNKSDKINVVYENGGIKNSKEFISKLTGVYIDKAVVLDFSSFEKIIDAVGGVDVVLDKPFEEGQQWGYKFYLPAGPNHLNGKDALYYSRSRFSSNDFDRARRQQQVLFALKEELSGHNWWKDPVKTFNIITSISSHIETDLNIWNTKELINLGKEIDSADTVKKYVISTENLLYDSRINGAYVLLPQGDNLIGLKQFFQDVIK